MNKKNLIITSALSLVVLFMLSAASAQTSITVNNPIFEAQPVPVAGNLITTPNGPTGWTGFRTGSGGNFDIGVGNASGPDFTTPLTAPGSGTNYLWLNDFNGNGTEITGVYQDVGALLADTSYTLTVAIGQRAGAAPNGQSSWSPGIITLLNGTDNTGTVLATTTGIPTTPNTWEDFTASFITGATVSSDLTIELSVVDAPEIQADFSNVELTATAVPEPTTCALLGGGFISLMAIRRRKSA
jgi:hypothetical protein